MYGAAFKCYTFVMFNKLITNYCCFENIIKKKMRKCPNIFLKKIKKTMIDYIVIRLSLLLYDISVLSLGIGIRV